MAAGRRSQSGCFNGAMTFRSWIPARDRGAVHMHASFNGAMTFRSWIPLPQYPVHQLLLCFNGAMTFRSWIHGPNRAPTAPATGRFNGAMTFRSWIRGTERLPHRRCDRFNGAMTFRSWIHPKSGTLTHGGTLLQWGHDLSVMDTRRGSDLRRDHHPASMGP